MRKYITWCARCLYLYIGRVEGKTVNNIKALKRTSTKHCNVLININHLYSLYNRRGPPPSGGRPKRAGSTRCRCGCFPPCKTCPESLRSPHDGEDTGKSGDTGTRSSCSPRPLALCVCVRRTGDKVPFAGTEFSATGNVSLGTLLLASLL